MSSLLSQLPAGAVLDSIRDKRRAVLLGIVGVGFAALLLCVTAARPAVYIALAIKGLASAVIGPGIAAINWTPPKTLAEPGPILIRWQRGWGKSDGTAARVLRR
jgi:MFS family permease